MKNTCCKLPFVGRTVCGNGRIHVGFLLLLMAPFIVFYGQAKAQVTGASMITTVAGTGVSGYTGDGGQATAAQLAHPANEVTDSAGNIYFSDYGNYRVRKINFAGIISTIGGNGTSVTGGDGGPATAAGISIPGGIVVKGSDVYVGEVFAGKVRKINAVGYISTYAGNGTSGFGGDGGPATAAMLNTPEGMMFDATGNLYIADGGNRRIRKVDTAGIITTFAGSGGTGSAGDGGPATAATFTYPTDLAMDAAGNIYITDDRANVVRMVNTSGIISTVAGTGAAAFGGDGGPASAASFNEPASIAIDRFGKIYISEYNSLTTDNRVRVIDAAGNINTLCGNATPAVTGDGGPASAAALNLPSKVWADISGNIYIMNANGNRLRVVSLPPIRFVHGHAVHDTICQNEVAQSINSLLSAADSNINRTVTWSLLTPPTHGTAVITYSVTSTGAAITPAGTSYAPASGYTGADSIRVVVSDGRASDTISVYFQVKSSPVAIVGPVLVLIGTTALFTDAASGGTWSSSNISIATIGSSTGLLAGISWGPVTITYTISSGCYVTDSVFVYWEGAVPQSPTAQGLSLYPNPFHDQIQIGIGALANGTATLKLFDELGRLVWSESRRVTANRFAEQLQLGNLPNGAYFLYVVDQDGKVLHLKLVKE